MMAPFPEGFSGDLDQQWLQAVHLLGGTVIVSGSNTPERLYFSFLTQWPTQWKGDIDQTWAQGVSMMYCGTATQQIPLSITPFPEGFQGNLNETWQQGLTQITGMVP